ncbi:MAG: hypothetical protein LBP71_05790 [Spirochaetaceae bacterium]|jgi:hypothetical protein|nr:hypothetical protein [Spirochaetaceae bacterium]
MSLQGKFCRKYQPRIQRITLFGSLLFLAAGAMVSSQESFLEQMIPGLKEQAVILDIVARVVEQNQEEVWHSVNSKVTIPGRPVGIKLIGENIVVVVQFTPYLGMGNKGHNMLVAQGQIWVNVPDEGIRYQTTMQTIPLEYGEQIYFFPLGRVDTQNEARIEIQLEIRPYSEDDGGAVEEDPSAPEAGGIETPP